MKWLILLLFIPVCSVAQVITTVVGGGSTLGNGGSATEATIDDPTQINFDKEGNLYIATGFGCRIRKVDTAGIITTIAGTGIPGYSGDSGPATAAGIAFGAGVVVDNSGNVFISDGHYGAIRRVDAVTHIITTICGNDVGGYSGDGGHATAARIYGPSAISMDKIGNLYIADCNNNVIRKIDTAGIIHTIAGTGVYGYNGDGIQATNAQLYLPTDVQVDDTGNIFIADNGNARIRKVNTSGIISTYAGNGNYTYIGDGVQATAAQFEPLLIKFNSMGDLYISDEGVHNVRVYKIDHNTGIFYTIAGNGSSINSGDGGQATAASFSGYPSGVAFDPCDNLYIANIGASPDSDRVREVLFNPSCRVDALNTSITAANNYINIYPNPTYDILNINNLKTPATYTLQSIVGATVQQSALKEGNNSINIQHVPNGMYMLEIMDTEGNRTNNKIVKQ